MGTESPVHQDEVCDFSKLEDTDGPKWRWHSSFRKITENELNVLAGHPGGDVG